MFYLTYDRSLTPATTDQGRINQYKHDTHMRRAPAGKELQNDMRPMLENRYQSVIDIRHFYYNGLSKIN